MAEERKTMDLEGLPAPALGVEERSDEPSTKLLMSLGLAALAVRRRT